MMMRIVPAAFALLLIAGPAVAQSPAPAAQEPACPVQPAPLPQELAPFRTPAAAAAGDGAPGAAAPAITAGKAVALALAPTGAVAFPAAPSRPQPDGFGGLAILTVETAGTYRIALSAGAWLEVARSGTLLRSIAHAHGPACSGVRKMVDFALAPGRYTIEIAGARAASITLLAVRIP